MRDNDLGFLVYPMELGGKSYTSGTISLGEVGVGEISAIESRIFQITPGQAAAHQICSS